MNFSQKTGKLFASAVASCGLEILASGGERNGRIKQWGGWVQRSVCVCVCVGGGGGGGGYGRAGREGFPSKLWVGATTGREGGDWGSNV